MAEAYDQATSTCSHCDRLIPFSNIDLHYAHCSRNLVKCKVCGDMVPGKLIKEHVLSTHATISCSLCNETLKRENLSKHKGQYCPQRIVICDYCEFPLPAVNLFKHQEVCGNRTELCNLCSRYVRLRERVNHESRCNGVPSPTTTCSHCDRMIPFSNIDLHYAHCSRNLVKCKVCGDMVPGKLIKEHVLSTHATSTCRIMKELCNLCSRYVRLGERVNHESICNGVPNIPAESSRDTQGSESAHGPRRRQHTESSPTHLIFGIAVTGIAVLLGSVFIGRKGYSSPDRYK